MVLGPVLPVLLLEVESDRRALACLCEGDDEPNEDRDAVEAAREREVEEGDRALDSMAVLDARRGVAAVAREGVEEEALGGEADVALEVFEGV